MTDNVINTDVLVIGGGLAGAFAAVKAREQGVDVTLVSKGNIGRSGQTPWASATFVISPDWEDKYKELIDQAYVRGEYLNNRDWTERIVSDSNDRFKDLESWGIPFLKDEKGEFLKVGMGKFVSPLRWWEHSQVGEFKGDWVGPLKNYPKKIGVRILERIMIVDLIKQDGRVAGAIGISTNTWDLHVFKAASTVICTGSSGFKPVGGWPIGDLTADGHVMAYKAGAEITGKEFEDSHNGMVRREGRFTFPPPFKVTNAEGDDFSGMGDSLDFEAHAGRAPLTVENQEVFGNVALGMSVHTVEGIWPVDEDCSAGIPGLYAAGDSCGSMTNGAMYAIMGSGTAAASVTGARAGTAAAIYAKQGANPKIDEEELGRLKESILTPANRKGGFSPDWVTQLLRNTMMPYYILRIKHGDRLQAALTSVEFMRDHLCPKIFARDPHELRLAHETKNMIINAEMKLRASLFRTESRGAHYREDYPRRSDPDWLAWVLLKEEDNRMKSIKRPIPKEWWPDLSIPYEERYPHRFPGE